MQVIEQYIRMNGATAIPVDANNSQMGQNAPSFSRGQQLTIKLGIFADASATELMKKADINAIAATWKLYGDAEYSQATTALTSSIVTVGDDNMLEIVLSTTNSQRMQTICGSKAKTTLHCSLVGSATDGSQPLFVADFDMVVTAPVSTSGLA